MMKKVALAFCITSPVWADSSSLNLQLPSGPTSYQSDSFRAGNLDCKNAIGGGTNLEFGVTGVLTNVGSPYDEVSLSRDPSRDVGVYDRVVIPLDKPKERINCNTLYKLELQQRRLEILKLQKELEGLRALQEEANFEN